MKEDFIQNIQFDLFTVELVIGETATLLLAENYVTIREVFVDGVKVEPNEEKQIFLPSGGDNLWELAEGDIVVPAENRKYTSKTMQEVDEANGSTDKFLNEQGDFTKPINSHSDLINKNDEASFQHVTQAERALISSTATVVNGHTEYIADLQSNKADKATTLSGYGITDAYTKSEVNIKFDNTRTYKILNTVVSTWVESSTYAAYKYEATINIENLIEGDFVLVIFDDMEATNGNYSPIQQQYNGYIKIYSKVNNTITIPTMVITKILL